MTQTSRGLGLTEPGRLGIGVPKSTGGATTEDAKAGKLTVDSTKLNEMLAADYTKVRDLFAGKGATKGLSGLISDYVGTQTGTNGMITEPDELRRHDAEGLHEARSTSSTRAWRPRKSV